MNARLLATIVLISGLLQTAGFCAETAGKTKLPAGGPADLNPAVTIDASKEKGEISKYIYGQFIEHLGRCIYGGIWAEMLEDRKFYYPVPAEKGKDIWTKTRQQAEVLAASPWQTVGEGDIVTMVEENSYVGEQTPQINLPGDSEPAGIFQEGLGILKGKAYVGRIVIAGDPEAAPIKVRLVWGEGREARSDATVEEIGKEFEKTTFRFEAGASSDNARLEIVGLGKGSFQVGTVSLMPADNVGGWRADTLKLLKELDSPVYRWPGGNFVSGYDWKDGVGERDRRPPRKNPAWTGIEHNDVGLHEYMFLCREIETEPFIAVNTGLGAVEGVREEVEYCNGSVETPMGKRRAENGDAEPFKVKWWAVGNEMYGKWQLGHMSLSDYVVKHNKCAEAMRSADPSIQLVGVGASGPWSKQMLTDCADHMDLISEHFYCKEKKILPLHVAQISDRVKAKADAHREYRKTIDSLKGKDIRIAMDEWNYWYGPHVFGELGTRYFLQDALGVARGLHEFFRNCDIIFMANYAQTVNVIGCIKTNKTSAAFETTGLALKLYRKHYGVYPVEVTGSPKPLDVAAAWTRDRKTLTVGIVNPTKIVKTLDLTLKGASLEARGVRYLITGPAPKAYNEPGAEPTIRIEEEVVKGPYGKIKAPAMSVTLYKLRRL